MNIKDQLLNYYNNHINISMKTQNINIIKIKKHIELQNKCVNLLIYYMEKI